MEELISEKAAAVLDLLEQIESVNEMIELHANNEFMRKQYDYRKQQFVKDLVAYLGQFEIKREDLAA